MRGKVLNHAALTDVGNLARPGDPETITHDPHGRTRKPRMHPGAPADAPGSASVPSDAALWNRDSCHRMGGSEVGLGWVKTGSSQACDPDEPSLLSRWRSG